MTRVHVITQNPPRGESPVIAVFTDEAVAEGLKELEYLSHHGEGYKIAPHELETLAGGYAARVDGIVPPPPESGSITVVDATPEAMADAMVPAMFSLIMNSPAPMEAANAALGGLLGMFAHNDASLAELLASIAEAWTGKP